MPIGLTLETDDGEVYGYGVIMPGEIGGVRDHDRNDERVIAVYCREDDLGGEVFVLKNEELDTAAEGLAIFLEKLNFEARAAQIVAFGSFEDEIIDGLIPGKLLAEHIPDRRNISRN